MRENDGYLRIKMLIAWGARRTRRVLFVVTDNGELR